MQTTYILFSLIRVKIKHLNRSCEKQYILFYTERSETYGTYFQYFIVYFTSVHVSRKCIEENKHCKPFII